MVYSVKAVRFFVIIVCRYILDALLCRVRLTLNEADKIKLL